MGESQTDKRRRLNRLAGEVLKFLELYHKIEPGTGVNEEPFDRKHKGSSRPPMSERALALSKANEDASKKITPLLEELRTHPGIAYRGFSFADLISEMRYDPGAVRRWRAARTGWEQTRADALWAMCRLVAQSIVAMHPAGWEPPMPWVVSDPRDAEADSPKQAAARDREAREREQHNNAKRKRAAHIREIQETENCGVEAAVGLWSDRMGMDERTGWRALAFVDGRETEERPEPGVWRDFGDDGNGGEAA